MRDFAVNPIHVYVAGLSAGGAAAAIMGSAYPDLYAAICVHSGLACGAATDMPSAFTAMRQGGPRVLEGAKRPLPTIVFHGDRDNTVSPANGDQVIAQSRAAAELHPMVSHGRSAGGNQLHAHRPSGCKRAPNVGALAVAWGRSCLVGWERGRVLHQPLWTRCKSRDAAILSRNVRGSLLPSQWLSRNCGTGDLAKVRKRPAPSW